MTGPGINVPITGDVSDLDRAMDRAEASLENAARTADRAADRIDSSMDGTGGGFQRVTDNAGAAATNLSILAGATGDVAGGVEAFGSKLGLSEEAIGGVMAASEGLSTALMFGAGVSDICAVATELLNGANIKSTALKIKDTTVTVAKSAAEKAAAAASRVAAAGQWALNAAMTANPIGLVIVAIAALVGGIVLAYKKSETFRNIVNKAFSAVKRVVMPVINWLKTAVPAGFQTVVSAVTGLPGKITALGGKFLSAGKSLMGKIFEGFKKVGSLGADIGRNLFNGVIGGINKAIDGVNDFLPDKISVPGPLPDINLPDNPLPRIPALAKGGIVTGPTLALIGEAGPEAVVPLNGRYGTGNTYVIKVTAPVGSSPADVGRTLTRYIDAYERAGGRRRA